MEHKLKESKKNCMSHGKMMIICCGIPLVLLVIAVYFFGLNDSYLLWGIILLCPIMHVFMMKDIHKKEKEVKHDDKAHDF